MSKTYRGALLVALVIGLMVPASAAAAVPAGVTKGLDYLRTRQRTDGGFSYSSSRGSPTTTPWVMLAIASGANNPARWTSAGRSPITYLQSIDLATAAKNSGNAPEYYALCILAYRTANRTDLLTNAGSGQIDLVDKLESYQSISDGFYSPSGGSLAATETTAWAILGLVAAHQSGPPLSGAVSWLKGQANTGGVDAGGFGSTPGAGQQSSTKVTALVVQALAAAGEPLGSGVVPGAIGFIKQMQVSDGGFKDTSDGFVSAQFTGWAIEAMHAAGLDPQTLVVNGHTPAGFLASLRQRNGSYHDYPTDIGDVMGATTQASFALGGRTLGSPPAKNRLTRFAPSFTSGSMAPKQGARLASRTVWIKAGYADNVNGTGVHAAAVRITVNGRSKTRAAHITTSHLTLELTKLANGTYTYVIRVRDWAGNSVRVERRFTVAVPASGSGSTGGGTHPGGSDSSTGSGGSSGSGGSGSSGSGGTTTHHTATPTPTATISPAATPGTTLTPTPAGSFPGGSTSPSPAAVTGQIAGSGGPGGGGGGTALAVGVTLATLLSLAFLGSWLVRRHLVGVMGGATRGEVLPRDATVWQRFWKPSGGPPPAGGGE
ncbi:MAG TPA: prenyltransferase/squalene oxidase repeat-containing protein [Thermoleophilia bacterium]|nr:prenyltransferase/squalene oxidase repeat-containing protein [Thermoleophilia bacterium]